MKNITHYNIELDEGVKEMIKLSKKGQSIMEYAVLISLVIAALTGMQLYVKRGLQARIKDASDNLPNYVATEAGLAGQVFNEGHTQYEPYYRGDSETTSTSTSGTEQFVVGGDSGQRLVTGQTRSITGSSTTGSWVNVDSGDIPTGGDPVEDPVDPVDPTPSW